MLIVKGNLHARLAAATEEERRWIESYLSYPDQRFTSRRRRQGDEAPRISIINQLDGKFAAGFVDLIARSAPTAGVKVDVIDKRTRPCAPDPSADLEWLEYHPAVQGTVTHQVDAVRAVMKHGRGIIWVPTSGGKTEIAIGLTRAIPCRWLFMVHRRNLMRQAAERYQKRTGMRAACAGDDQWDADAGTNRFTVAMFQTVAAALKSGDARVANMLVQAQAINVDECHILPANQFWSVVMKTPNAYYRVGMSGTPLARGDQKSILAIGALGPVIYRVRADDLIRLGIMAKPTIRLVSIEQEHPNDGLAPNEWQEVYRALVVESEPRNDLLVKVAKRAAKPCLVFVKEIDHGRVLEKKIRAAGIPVEFVWGTATTAKRTSACRRLVRGDIEVLICSVIFQEGADIPELRSVVNASGGASVIGAIQRVGRGARATEDKDAFEVWDVADRGDKWLTKHARARARAYVAEHYETVVVPSIGGSLP